MDRLVGRETAARDGKSWQSADRDYTLHSWADGATTADSSGRLQQTMREQEWIRPVERQLLCNSGPDRGRRFLLRATQLDKLLTHATDKQTQFRWIGIQFCYEEIQLLHAV